VLQQIIDYFAAQMLDGQLSSEDATVLEETTQYPSSLTECLSAAQLKLTEKARWSRKVNKAMWMFHENDLLVWNQSYSSGRRDSI